MRWLCRDGVSCVHGEAELACVFNERSEIFYCFRVALLGLREIVRRVALSEIDLEIFSGNLIAQLLSEMMLGAVFQGSCQIAVDVAQKICRSVLFRSVEAFVWTVIVSVQMLAGVVVEQDFLAFDFDKLFYFAAR